MVAKRQCSFCAEEIEPGTGTTFVKRDGTVFQFCTSSCRKQQLQLGRLGHRLKWTRAYALKKAAERSSAARPSGGAAAARAPAPSSPAPSESEPVTNAPAPVGATASAAPKPSRPRAASAAKTAGSGSPSSSSGTKSAAKPKPKASVKAPAKAPATPAAEDKTDAEAP